MAKMSTFISFFYFKKSLDLSQGLLKLTPNDSLSPHNCLTHYHTILYFGTPKIYSCGKHCEKRRNCLCHFPFLTMFSTLFGTYFPF